MRTALWLFCLLLGCGGESEQPVPRPRGPVPTPIAQEPPAAAEPAAETPSPTSPWPDEAQAPKKETKAEKVTEPEKRDYPAELLGAIGSPVDCLKPREGPGAPKNIDVELEVYFLQTGAQSRGYARSPQLDAQELQCIRSRLESIALRGPIDEAPRMVQATLSFKLKTPVDLPK